YCCIQFLTREQSVALKEYKTGSQGGALIAIDKGMIAADVEQITRRYFQAVFKQRHASHCGLGSGDSGFEQWLISNSRRTAVRSQNLLVNRADRLTRRMRTPILC